MISGERKKFGLRARKSVKHPNPLLNNTVLLTEGEKRYACTIGFNDDLIQFVGQKLPRGLAEFDPAYLLVTELPGKGWKVQASYFRDGTLVDLWVAKERPTWLKSFNT